jgi:hypothetical protein
VLGLMQSGRSSEKCILFYFLHCSNRILDVRFEKNRRVKYDTKNLSLRNWKDVIGSH